MASAPTVRKAPSRTRKSKNPLLFAMVARIEAEKLHLLCRATLRKSFSATLSVDDLVQKKSWWSGRPARVAAPSLVLSPSDCEGAASRIAGPRRWEDDGETESYVGIDVTNTKLDIFVGRTGENFPLPNTDCWTGQMLRRPKPDDFVIVEATPGGAGCQCVADGLTPGSTVNKWQCAISRASARRARLDDPLDVGVLSR
jgi:hypothetical protein